MCRQPLTSWTARTRAWCAYDVAQDYGVRFLDIGGWPAMQQSYVAPALVCGECPPTTEPAFLAYADVYLAAGSPVFTIQAVVSSEEEDSLAVLFQVAGTFRVDNGQTPADAAGDLVELWQSDSDSCML